MRIDAATFEKKDQQTAGLFILLSPNHARNLALLVLCNSA